MEYKYHSHQGRLLPWHTLFIHLLSIHLSFIHLLLFTYNPFTLIHSLTIYPLTFNSLTFNSLTFNSLTVQPLHVYSLTLHSTILRQHCTYNPLATSAHHAHQCNDEQQTSTLSHLLRDNGLHTRAFHNVNGHRGLHQLLAMAPENYSRRQM